MSGSPALATAITSAPHSGIRELANAATLIPGAIRLDLGQPDFPTPTHIVEAAKRALDDGWTAYTPTQGLRSLRELIAHKIDRINGYRVHPDQVATAPGGVGVIAAAFAAVLEPGDEVLLPDPAWPNYRLMAAWTHSQVVRYPCSPAADYLPDLDRLRALMSRRSKLLVLNSPNNPTGSVYPPEVVREIAELAERHNCWLLSDECYDQLVYEDRGVSPAALLGGRHIISAYSFSKTYAMTGWRLGYLAGSKRLVDSVTKVLESQSSCAPSVSQKAGEAALNASQECVQLMAHAYRQRRDMVVEQLRDAGLLISVPKGAFYIMADISRTRLCSRDFALRLLQDQLVSVAPGGAFGEVAGQSVRISLASSQRDLYEGIKRLCLLARRLEAAVG